MSRPAYFGGANRPPARYNPAPKPAKVVKTKPSKSAPLGISTAGLTPQQWVAQALRAEMAPLEYTEHAREKRAAETRQQTQYATQAIIKELGAQAAPVAVMFDAGLAQQKAYATQYADMLKQANPNASIQADLQAIGAPAAQQQQLAQQGNANYTGQAAALFNTGGVIPGENLIGQRNAQVAYLAGMPTVAALQGQQALGARAREDAAAYQDYVANRMKIGAQAPGLIRQVEQDRLAQHNALVSQLQRDQQLADNARALGDREAYQAAQIRLSADRYNLSASRYGTQQDQFNRSLALRQQQAAAAATKKAQAAADKKAASNLKTAKQKTAYFYRIRARAFSDVKSIAREQPPGSAAPLPGIKPKRRYSRGGAFNVLWRNYYAPLNAAGFKRSTIRTMINRALDTQYPPKVKPKTVAPGSRGR